MSSSKAPPRPASLMTSDKLVMSIESRTAVIALYQSRNVLFQHRATQPHGNHIDELFAAKNAAQVGIIEDALGSRQSQGRSGDGHRQLRGFA